MSAAALEAQAGDGGFMCHGDPGGGAGVPQVVVVDLPLSGPDYQTSTVRSEVYRGQRTVHPDRPQDTGDTQYIADNVQKTSKTPT